MIKSVMCVETRSETTPRRLYPRHRLTSPLLVGSWHISDNTPGKKRKSRNREVSSLAAEQRKRLEQKVWFPVEVPSHSAVEKFLVTRRSKGEQQNASVWIQSEHQRRWSGKDKTKLLQHLLTKDVHTLTDSVQTVARRERVRFASRALFWGLFACFAQLVVFAKLVKDKHCIDSLMQAHATLPRRCGSSGPVGWATVVKSS